MQPAAQCVPVLRGHRGLHVHVVRTPLTCRCRPACGLQAHRRSRWLSQLASSDAHARASGQSAFILQTRRTNHAPQSLRASAGRESGWLVCLGRSINLLVACSRRFDVVPPDGSPQTPAMFCCPPQYVGASGDAAIMHLHVHAILFLFLCCPSCAQSLDPLMVQLVGHCGDAPTGRCRKVSVVV